MKLQFKKLERDAILPEYALAGDGAFDLFSLENYLLQPGERYLFKIGLVSQIPTGFCVIVKPKSGLAVKVGIDALAGVIDSGYRGEWGVLLINSGGKSYQFKKGDKIAQGLLLRLPQVEIKEIKELSLSRRGQSGFGSTGRS